MRILLRNVLIPISLFFAICSPSVNYFLDPYSDFARYLSTSLKLFPLVPLTIYVCRHSALSSQVLLTSFLFAIPPVSRFINFIPLNNASLSCFHSYCSSTSVDPQILNQILFSLYLPFIHPWLLGFKLPFPVIFSIGWTFLNSLMFLLVFFGIALPLHNVDYGFFSGVVGNPNSFSAICLLIVSIITFRDTKYFRKYPFVMFILVSVNLAFSFLSGSLLGLLLAVILGFVFFFSILIVDNSLSLLLRFLLFTFSAIIATLNFSNIESFLSSTLGANSFSVTSKFLAALSGSEFASATLRSDYMNYALLYITHFDCLIIGFCGDSAYIAGDGYLPTLAISFGIPLSLLYIISFYKLNRLFGCLPDLRLFLRLSSWLSPCNYSYIYYLILLFFILLVNRIQDYWPALLCFFILMNKLDSRDPLVNNIKS